MNSQYKKANSHNISLNQRDIKYSYYKGPVKQNKSCKSVYMTEKTEHKSPPLTQIKWETSNYTNMSDPKVWGPSLWFTIHNGARNYPVSASPFAINRMKGFIMGIPMMLPCEICKIHAANHINKNRNKLDEICSGRDILFKFFVDFHNMVNKRYNKPVMSYEDAYDLYNGKASVSIMSY